MGYFFFIKICLHFRNLSVNFNWTNKYFYSFSVLISNAVNIDSYNPYKQSSLGSSIIFGSEKSENLCTKMQILFACLVVSTLCSYPPSFHSLLFLEPVPWEFWDYSPLWIIHTVWLPVALSGGMLMRTDQLCEDGA